MSALQVEKHPITTPGPYATPSLARHPMSGTPYGLYSVYQQMTSASPPLRRCSPPRSPTPRPGSGASSSGSYGSPRPGDGYRSSPRPHSSPKMKLRFFNILILFLLYIIIRTIPTYILFAENINVLVEPFNP
jgi:hypothetical protein